ncbi:hypothetical protein [Nocardioides panacisoli]|uniref:hypothetical protein n=1 Tax=Nocardioides panacisoli TaxID=627624 RepID=UPI0031D36AD1
MVVVSIFCFSIGVLAEDFEIGVIEVGPFFLHGAIVCPIRAARTSSSTGLGQRQRMGPYRPERDR